MNRKLTKDELYVLVYKICSAFYVPGKQTFQPSVKGNRDTEKVIVFSEVRTKLGAWAPSLKLLRELSDKCVDECAIKKNSGNFPEFRR